MKSREAGGIVTFLIVAAVLAGLLAGGLYLSKSMGRADRENDASTPPVATSDNEEPETKPEEKPAAQNGSQPAPAGQTGGTQTPTNQTNRPATGTAPAQNRVATTGPSENIPSTGPAETVAFTLALAGLTFAGSRYVVSRHARTSAALDC